MKKKLSTRIISGKYRGKVLELPSLDSTRSSKSILKESFFNVVQYDIIDTIFIEAFSGSGSIGLEAISRGANSAYFVEIDKLAFETLRKNCNNINMNKCTTMMGDSFKIIPNIVNNQLKNTTNEIIIYLDPPFDCRQGMDEIYYSTFKMIKKFENQNIALIAIEHKSELKITENIGKFQQFKTKKFGNSSLTYFKINRHY
jgi:16S rRNA (guanine(966)-N(2))-methyltransferase RsmD